MRTAVDTNVFSALWSEGPLEARMVTLLGRAGSEGGLVICAPVYAELLAHARATEKFLDEFLSTTNVSVDFALDEAIWREAGRRFASYATRRRKSGGRDPKRLLVDFLIGAHALLRADRLFTLDDRRYARDFPTLRLM